MGRETTKGMGPETIKGVVDTVTTKVEGGDTGIIVVAGGMGTIKVGMTMETTKAVVNMETIKITMVIRIVVEVVVGEMQTILEVVTWEEATAAEVEVADSMEEVVGKGWVAAVGMAVIDTNSRLQLWLIGQFAIYNACWP